MRKYMLAIVGILLITMNANAAFPVNDAGIAAYVRIGESVDLNKTIWAYDEIVNINKLDIIGKVKVESGNPSYYQNGACCVYYYSYPLVYVGADGWVVAYYPKSEPASMIMQWKGYSKPYINTTTLADAISIMTTKLGVNYDSIKGNIKYYDFRYPEADQMMVIVKGHWSTVSFSLFMQKNFTLYNASFSHEVWCGKLIFDSNVVSEYCGGGGYGPWIYRNGFYNIDLFEREKFHNVELRGSSASTVLLFRNN